MGTGGTEEGTTMAEEGGEVEEGGRGMKGEMGKQEKADPEKADPEEGGG